jgi:plastocyanin
MRRLALLSLFGAALVLAGCGGLKKGGLTPVGNEEGTQQPAKAQSLAKVDMVNIKFAPGTIRVRPGGEVVWINRDKIAHTVTNGDDLYNEFSSGTIEPGERYRKVFNGERKIGYRCTIHPNMEGIIFVSK